MAFKENELSEQHLEVRIDFFRTIRLTRIALYHVSNLWYREIRIEQEFPRVDWWLDKHINMSEGLQQNKWNEFEIDDQDWPGPLCATAITVLLDCDPFGYNCSFVHDPNKPSTTMLDKLRLYGNEIKANCTMRYGNHIDCDDGEICDVSSGNCIKGCDVSEKCNDGEYCDVKTHQCTQGYLSCGLSLYTASTRIVNGKESIPHSRPWAVSIRRCGSCSGTLITSKHVLTAAHCVDNELGLSGVGARIKLGDHDCKVYESGEQHVLVKHVYSHPRYWKSKVISGDRMAVFDIAILTGYWIDRLDFQPRYYHHAYLK